MEARFVLRPICPNTNNFSWFDSNWPGLKSPIMWQTIRCCGSLVENRIQITWGYTSKLVKFSLNTIYITNKRKNRIFSLKMQPSITNPNQDKKPGIIFQALVESTNIYIKQVNRQINQIKAKIIIAYCEMSTSSSRHAAKFR